MCLKASLSAHPAFCLQWEKWTEVFSLGPALASVLSLPSQQVWLSAVLAGSCNGSACRTITLQRGEAATATGHLSYPLSTSKALKTLSNPQSPQCAFSHQSLTVHPVLVSACSYQDTCEGLGTRPWFKHRYRRR